MPAPLELTFQTLANSRNEAATDVLLAALESDVPAIVNGALTALMTRRSKAGHLAVLRRWHVLSSGQLELLRAGRGRIGAALRDALVSNDAQLCKNACEFVLAFNEYDALPTLITIAEGADLRRAEPALVIVTQLVEQLSRLVSGNRDSSERRDPEALRRNVLESLERSLERYRRHRRDGLVEAFVTLAGPNSQLLLQLLDSPHHPCYSAVVQALHENESVGVVGLLTKILELHEAPQTVVAAVSRRTDAAFVRTLLNLPLNGAGSMLRKNLARVKSLAFLEPSKRIVELSEAAQAAAINLLMYTGVDLGEKLLAAEHLLNEGAAAGRLAACVALGTVPGDHANRLILKAADDEEPVVKPPAAARLHERHVPGALSKLLELVDHVDPEVATAARAGLADLNFENYLQRFDSLDEESRASSGTIAVKIDETAVDQLRQELTSQSRRARLRAIEIIELLELAPATADALVERLDDPDHLVRTAAAEALRNCTGSDVRDALIRSLEDHSVAVQRAAKTSLDAMEAAEATLDPQAAATEEMP